VTLIEKRLRRGNHLLRYATLTIFGLLIPLSPCAPSGFIEALAAIGRDSEAREMFEALLALRSPLGLLSEDIMIETGELWGTSLRPTPWSSVICAPCA